MKDVYDMVSGMSYVALTSRKARPAKKQSTLAQGLMIAIGFMASAIIVMAVGL